MSAHSNRAGFAPAHPTQNAYLLTIFTRGKFNIYIASSLNYFILQTYVTVESIKFAY